MPNDMSCDTLTANHLVIVDENNQPVIVLDGGKNSSPSIKLLGKYMIEISCNGDNSCKINLRSSHSSIEMSVENDIPNIQVSHDGESYSWNKR